MAKRFTDTNKYKKPFIRSLKGAYKLLWDYLYHDCDHAGIWIVDFDIAQIYIGSDMPINKEEALKYFNKDEHRIIEIDNGSKWFIPSFIQFQYGELNENNRAHNSVMQILKNKGLLKNNKPLTSPLKGAMDKDKDKVKDKDKEPYRKFSHLKITNNENNLLLESGYTQSEIDSIYDSIENYKKNTQYKSLYLTAKKWLKKEFGDKSHNTSEKTTVNLGKTTGTYEDMMKEGYEHGR